MAGVSLNRSMPPTAIKVGGGSEDARQRARATIAFLLVTPSRGCGGGGERPAFVAAATPEAKPSRRNIVCTHARSLVHGKTSLVNQLSLCFLFGVSEKKRRRIPISPKLVRFLFRAAHVVVPLVGTLFIVGHIAWHWRLSWELLVLIAMVLVPFVLPLLGFYVGKIGLIEMADRDFFEDFEALVVAINEAPPEAPGAVPAVPPPPPASVAAPEHGGPIPLDPHFNALTSEEQKVMRTLWRQQREYRKQGKSELWGFVVGSGSPDYRPFVRGVSSLMQRRLVKQDARGLVFLSDYGISYCDRNDDLLEKEGEVWTQFASA